MSKDSTRYHNDTQIWNEGPYQMGFVPFHKHIAAYAEDADCGPDQTAVSDSLLVSRGYLDTYTTAQN